MNVLGNEQSMCHTITYWLTIKTAIASSDVAALWAEEVRKADRESLRTAT